MINILITFIIITMIIIIAVLILANLETCTQSLFLEKFGLKNKKNTLLKPLSDALKMLIKEDLTPKSRKKILYFLAPIIMFCPIITAFSLIPINNNPQLNASISAILFLALLSIPVTGAFFAGYSSKNDKALISAARAIILAISFEIPMGISVFAISFFAGSLNINEIIMAQNGSTGLFGWYFIPQIIGCIIFFLAALMLLDFTPFSIAKAENELIEGFMAEYSGSRLALFCFSKYALILSISLFFVCLFFGGYLSPFGTYVLPQFLIPFEQIFWLTIKTFLVIFIIFSINYTLPKLNPERILDISYKILLPLSFINLNIAIIIQYFLGANL